MRETSQSHVEQTTNRTDDTLAALSSTADQRTGAVTEQDSLDELADKRYFEAETEPRTGGPIAHNVAFPEHE